MRSDVCFQVKGVPVPFHAPINSHGGAVAIRPTVSHLAPASLPSFLRSALSFFSFRPSTSRKIPPARCLIAAVVAAVIVVAAVVVASATAASRNDVEDKVSASARANDGGWAKM